MITDAVQVIAWDFDGVLNNNIENGQFVWSKTFEQDLGLSHDAFASYLFKGRFHEAMAGKADLRQLVSDWLSDQVTRHSADDILHYWFHRDARPDDRVLAMTERLAERGLINIMATNNEVHRTAFIERDMGFGDRMDHIFAAGRMGKVKPQLSYFEHIQETLNLPPGAFLLIDDIAENTDAAERAGWLAHHHKEGAYERLEDILDLS
ncbi:MAG: HAD-IA family hydrolase [Pseudomonadota bacterium]